MTGLLFEEVGDFLEHHFAAEQVKRLCEEGLVILFERAKGAPGFLLPMFRTLAKANSGKGKLAPDCVEEELQRWELP